MRSKAENVRVVAGTAMIEVTAEENKSRLKELLTLLRRNKALAVGAILVAIVLAVAIFAPWIAPYDPTEQHIRDTLSPPLWVKGASPSYILGTDTVGRDLLSRIIFGLRNSLVVSMSAVVVAVGIGVTIGLIAGYLGGAVHTILMRLTDIQMAFPFILLAVAILAGTEARGLSIVVVLALASWPLYARVIRAVVLTDKEMDYVVIARSMGASGARIIIRYLLRNIVVPIGVLATLDVATMIIYESILGFIGLGILPPTPTIGNVIGDGRNFLLSAWWIATMPGLVIVFVLFAFNLLGDALQGELDPRLRRS